MTEAERIELRETDVDAVARHMWEVEEATQGGGDHALCFDDEADEILADWLCWARAACAGAPARACGVGMPAWTAARGMARALAERRLHGDPVVTAKPIEAVIGVSTAGVRVYSADELGLAAAPPYVIRVRVDSEEPR